ncbi:MAG TPA: alpha/beta hydrolase [Luteolibacter sp.]|nr:alpha/beta hydrolase [Luteolibacter sp.]
MKRFLSFAFAALVLPLAAAEKIPLWPEGKAPVGDGTFTEGNAFITVHQPEKPNGAAMIICPGGGYRALVTGAEGHGIAAWLNQHGITGIVLEYRLPDGRSFVPLLDAQRALRTARLNAEAWKIDPKRTGIIGFSAGGHLASTAGTHFDPGDAEAEDRIERMSCRPDFMVLVYPVITMEIATHAGSRERLLGAPMKAELVELFSNEKQVTENTPPAFLAHAIDDKAVTIDNSRMFQKALSAKGVKAELLELPDGGHGLNGYKGPSWDAWQAGSIAWLKGIEVIPPSP